MFSIRFSKVAAKIRKRQIFMKGQVFPQPKIIGIFAAGNMADIHRKLKTHEMNRLSLNEFVNAEKFPFVVVLNNVRSLYNVGSVFRTSDAFKAGHIYLTGITGTPPHREITKTAIGAEKTVSWSYHKDSDQLCNELQLMGYTLIGIEQTTSSTPLNNFQWPEKKIAFIFGNEIEGIEDSIIKQCEVCLEIPQFGSKHSLNISVAAGVVLWHYLQKQIL